MEFTQLSLAGGQYANSKNGGRDGETSLSMKRKWKGEAHPSTVDLQFNNPLPSEWEQCLDLQSGKMYYANKKKPRKNLIRPEEQRLDLDLNIGNNSEKKEDSSSNMVALACSNCHLLVILSRSSPSCPNCKYDHFLASSSSKSSAPVPNWPL